MGGAVNGAIVGAATAIPGAGPLTGYIANAAGGFTGNLITEELNNLEIEYIAKYRSTDKHFGYNILEGGNAVPKTIKKQNKNNR